jgi:hypothetical protein
MAVGVFFWLETTRSRLIILREVVSMQHAFHTRTLHMDDIAGYRYVTHNRDRIRIIPNNPKLKKIDVPTHMEGRRELEAWLARFPNLDIAEYQAETGDIFSNKQFGATETERLAYLRKAKRTAQAANVVGLLTAAWLWIWPKPYDTAMISCLLMPWIAIYLGWRFKGLLRPATSRKGSPYPSAAGLLFPPAMVLLYRVMADYKVYEPSRIWPPLLTAALPVAGILLYTSVKAFAPIRRKVLGWLVLGILATVYSFTLVVFTNCYYNATPPRQLTVAVKGKHFVKDKTTTYYLTLAPWGRFTGEQDESVEPQLYHTVHDDGQVHIYLFEGRWHIPWYIITE